MRQLNEFVTEKETITPAIAERYLDACPDWQRNVSQSLVSFLAREMLDGNWVLTHQGIAFDADGKLIDGQHRMWAVVESGVQVEMMVSRGMPRDVYSHLDNGKTRGISDRFALNKKEAAIVNQLATIRRGTGGKASTVEVVNISGAYIEIIRRLLHKCSTSTRRLSISPVQASFVVRAGMLDRAQADEIIDQYRRLVIGDLSDKTWVSIRNLHSQLIKVSKLVQVKSSRNDDIVRAWCAVKNKELMKITIRNTPTHVQEIRDEINSKLHACGLQIIT